VHRQGKLAHHVAYHHELLVVLLAKHGVARAAGFGEHALEQLHDHGAHAREKPGSEVAFQQVGQRRRGCTLKVWGWG
jgi:hypothetical protein